jgi:predicted dehydrogenase
MTTDQSAVRANFRVGLIGLGAVANYHIAVARRLKNISLIAACDPAQSKRDHIQKRWKLSNLYSSLDEMLDREELDVVHVLTPPLAHVPVALRCLERRIHCLIEKPIAMNLAEGNLLSAAARESGGLVAVNHNKIWNPAFRKLVALVHTGRLGDLRHVNVLHAVHRSFRSGDWSLDDLSYPVLETAPHTFSLVNELIGKLVEVRSDVCDTLRAGENSIVCSWQSSVKCELGTASLFVSLHGALPCCSVTVLGTEGSAVADLMGNVVSYSTRFGKFEPYERVLKMARDGFGMVRRSMAWGAVHAGQRFGISAFGDPFLESMRRSIEEFYTALSENREPKANLLAGIETVKSCLAVTRSFSTSNKNPMESVFSQTSDPVLQ